MNSKLTVLFAALLALACPASADLFTGSFTLTVTNSRERVASGDDYIWQPIESLPEGFTFQGDYNYESDTMDGFFAAQFDGPLNGSVTPPSLFWAGGPISIDDGSSPAVMNVTNGIVDFFGFHPSMGHMDGDFSLTTFALSEYVHNRIVQGTIDWSAPIDSSLQLASVENASVPDIWPTAWLLVGGLAAMVVFPRTLRRVGRVA